MKQDTASFAMWSVGVARKSVANKESTSSLSYHCLAALHKLLDKNPTICKAYGEILEETLKGK